MNDIFSYLREVIVEKIDKEMIEFVHASGESIDEFWKSLYPEELYIYAQHSKAIDDMYTYDKLHKILKMKIKIDEVN